MDAQDSRLTEEASALTCRSKRAACHQAEGCQHLVSRTGKLTTQGRDCAGGRQGA